MILKYAPSRNVPHKMALPARLITIHAPHLDDTRHDPSALKRARPLPGRNAIKPNEELHFPPAVVQSSTAAAIHTQRNARERITFMPRPYLHGPIPPSAVHLCIDMQSIFAPGGLWAAPWMGTGGACRHGPCRALHRTHRLHPFHPAGQAREHARHLATLLPQMARSHVRTRRSRTA